MTKPMDLSKGHRLLFYVASDSELGKILIHI